MTFLSVRHWSLESGRGKGAKFGFKFNLNELNISESGWSSSGLPKLEGGLRLLGRPLICERLPVSGDCSMDPMTDSDSIHAAESCS